MSLRLMKTRIKQSGSTLYDEQIKDTQDILIYGFKDDVSYNPNIVAYKTNEKIPVRIYNQKYSALYGFTADFLSPHNVPVELGKLLYDTKNQNYWLCVESYNVSDIHNEGKLGKCGRFLKWQDENGIIQQTPVITTSASKYNNGENGTAVVQLGSDQLMLFMQLNKDTVKLDRGMKFFIDENKVKPSVYELTRTDTALYSYMSIGFMAIIVTECAYTPSQKELELGVCNYKEPLLQNPESDKTADFSASIKGNTNLKNGYERTYTAILSDKDDNAVNWDDTVFSWNVVSDFKVEQNIDENKIRLKVNDESLTGSSFLLQLKNKDSVIAKTKINIVDLIS